MFSKAEASKLKQEFWTTLGRLLQDHPSAEGVKINWINYKTGVKDIYFRMQADKKSASISIEFAHKDDGLKEIFFEQMTQLKSYLHSILEEEWIWEEEFYNDYGIKSARIYTFIDKKNYYLKDDWQDLFAFFKPRIIKLDEFWSDAKETFIELSR